jgi:hypothetical protein
MVCNIWGLKMHADDAQNQLKNLTINKSW